MGADWRIAASLLASVAAIILVLVATGAHGPPRHERPAGPVFHVIQSKPHLLEAVVRGARARGMSPSGYDGLNSVAWGEWDLLWSMAFTPMGQLPAALRPEQRINHLPGNRWLASKPHLWQTFRAARREHGAALFDFMPRHWLVPEEAAELDRAVAAAAPGQRFVVKNRRHRGISVLDDPRGFRGGEAKDKEKVMVAEYVEPLLIGGRKWDVGLYVLVPSVEPLRVYVYDNALMRLCRLPYPASGVIDGDTDTEAYVIVDYIPPWDVPELARFYAETPSAASQGSNTLHALMAHLDADPALPAGAGAALKRGLHAAIVRTLQAVAPTLREAVKEVTPHPGVFFEMWRWDFAVDAQGRPKLLEVNMSPNLVPKRFASGTDEALKRGVVEDVLELVSAGCVAQSPVEPSEQLCRRHCSTAGTTDLTQEVCWGCPGSPVAEAGHAAAVRAAAHEFRRRGRFELAYPPATGGGFEVLPPADAEAEVVGRVLAALAAAGGDVERLPRVRAPGASAEVPAPPPVAVFCVDRGGCGGHGDCLNGRCRCEGAWHGDYCEVHATAGPGMSASPPSPPTPTAGQVAAEKARLARAMPSTTGRQVLWLLPLVALPLGVAAIVVHLWASRGAVAAGAAAPPVTPLGMFSVGGGGRAHVE